MPDDKDTPCACGSTTFERVVIERPERDPYRTDFVACTHCRAMFLLPEPAPPPTYDAMRTYVAEARQFTKSGKRRR